MQNLGLAVPVLASPLNPILASGKSDRSLVSPLRETSFSADFGKLNERVWIGRSFWAVPMEDWGIKNGRLEFSGVEKQSRLHVLTYVLGEGQGDFTLSGNLGLLENKGDKGGVGFALGIKDRTDPTSVKAACYFGKGISTGVGLEGILYIGERKESLPSGFDFDNFSLQLKGRNTGEGTELVLEAKDSKGKIGRLDHAVKGALDGWVALENKGKQKKESTFWWADMAIVGNEGAIQAGKQFWSDLMGHVHALPGTIEAHGPTAAYRD